MNGYPDYEVYEDDYRNATVRVHGQGGRPPAPWWNYGRPPYHPGNNVVVVPNRPGPAPMPWRQMPPPMPAPMPGYYGAPPMPYDPYAGYYPPRRGLLDGVDKGQLVEAALLALAGFRSVPALPPSTGVAATDNLAIQNQNNANYFRGVTLALAAGKAVNAFITG